MGFSDRELGLHRNVSQRDFLNGMTLAIGGAGAPGLVRPARAQTAYQKRIAVTGSTARCVAAM
jgi:hypothetical protein